MPVNTQRSIQDRTIRVAISRGEEGLFYAVSPDLAGLLVAKPDMTELHRDIPRAIEEIFILKGERVSVARVAQRDAFEFWAVSSSPQ